MYADLNCSFCVSLTVLIWYITKPFVEFGKRKGPHHVALFGWGEVFNSQGGVAALNCWFEPYV